MTDTTRTHRQLLALVFALYAGLVVRFWFLADDAFITFRYARNWANGLGLAFNPGERPPVEGYSNFLWLIGATLVEAVGAPIGWVAPVVSAACGGALVWKTHDTLRNTLGVGATAALIGTASLGLSPALGVWSTSGLETAPFALLVLMLTERLVLRDAPDDWMVPAGLSMLLVLIRAEGFAWIGVIAAAALLTQPGQVRRVLSVGGAVAALLAVYWSWRLYYFGTLLPHTALVKVSGSPRAMVRGAKYVGLFWLTVLVPAVSLLGAVPTVTGPDARRWRAVLLMALAFPAYAVVVGGDFMPFGRLLVPGLPFAAILLGGGLDALLARGVDPRRVTGGALLLLLVGLQPASGRSLVPAALRRPLHFRMSDNVFLSERDRWANQAENTAGFQRRGRALAQVAAPGSSVVAAAVGAVGYYSGIEVLDQHGLVTKEVAYRPIPSGPLTRSPGHDRHVPPAFFVKYSPTYLYARAVEGTISAGRMKDTLDQWQVPLSVMDSYVPDFHEVTAPDASERAFLFVVRRSLPGEDPAKQWSGFPARRRALNSELRAAR